MTLKEAERIIEEQRDALNLAAHQLDKAAYIISHTDSFQAGECWRYARKCAALTASEKHE